MSKNTIRKKVYGSGTFTVPAGVTKLTVRKYPDVVTYENGAAFNRNHVLALTSNGSAWAWGSNSNGELGNGSYLIGSGEASPVQVIGGHSFFIISSGIRGNTSFALKSDGSAWAWGVNSVGQLGDNSIISRSSPVQVVGGHSFIKIGGNFTSTIALKADGSAWTWGGSNLGDGTIIPKSSPVQVVGGHSFIDISIGSNFCIALKSDGNIWGWGSNDFGQLGQDPAILSSTLTPIQVTSGHSFSYISSGSEHFIALKSDGTVWGQGANANGQLGDNTIIPKSSAVQVIGGYSFSKISAGGYHGLGLQSNGSVWSWGSNNSGQLGNGLLPPSSSSSPIQVIGGHSFVSVSGSLTNSLALKSDGTAWAWGANSLGQVGDGIINLTPTTSPSQVIGGLIFSGADKATEYYFLPVRPNDNIEYANGYFGLVRISGPWLIEYEA